MDNPIAEQKNLLDKNLSAFQKYKRLYFGPVSFWYILKYELIVTLFTSLPGALGLLLRKIFFPCLFQTCGRGVIFGRNMTIRHPKKITIGGQVIFDDYCVIDAKGENNHGICLGNNCVIGRNTVVSCKGGDIEIGDYSNIGPNNQLVSETILKIGKHVFTAGHCTLMAGGNHDFSSTDKPIWFQPSLSKGGIVIADDIWLGLGVNVLDGVTIENGSVIGASSLVTRSIPAYSIAVGIPAKIIKNRHESR
jgi:acetyltransferase-like isoleucine patch superfamily enzyme